MRRTALGAVLLLAAACGGSGAGLPGRPAEGPMSASREMPRVGEPAPDFTLIDQDRNPVTLSDFRGRSNVVLAFYVLAFTGG